MGVLSEVLRAWCAEPKGRVLLIGWATTFAGVTLRAVMLRQKRLALALPKPAGDKGASDKDTAPNHVASKGLTPLRHLQRLAIPRWKSKPVVWFGLLSTGIGLRLIVQVKNSSEIGALGALLAKQDWPALYQRQLTYALYGIPAALFLALQKFAAGNAALAMRDNLTDTLHARYEATSSLPAALTAVEQVAGGDEGVQRGTSDLDAYCTSSVALFEAVLKPSVEVILISTKLAMMMGPSQLFSCMGFFGLAGSWVRMVGPGFATLAADVQAAEGTLLSHRTRLHTYAEEVTMLRGASVERQLMDRAADIHSRTTARLAMQRFGSDVLSEYVLRNLGILAAFTAMLPAIMRGAEGAGGAGDPTQYFLTCLHLLVQLGLALKDLVLSHRSLATTRGLAGRVHELLDALESVAPASSAPLATAVAAIEPPPLLQLTGVRVVTPAGKELLRDVTLEISAGMRVLVRGPNGAGKSSLLRVLTGAWPLADGAGQVSWGLGADDRLVLPQRSYLIPQLSLKANLAYPAVDGQGQPTLASMPPDAELLALLERVGLSRLAPAGAADLAKPNGGDGLSPGERQRLGLARLLLRKPALAVLDEPCSSVEPGFEAQFFAECAAAGMTLLTIAHRAELAQHHTHELRLNGRGRATLKELSADGKGSDGSEDLVDVSEAA